MTLAMYMIFALADAAFAAWNGALYADHHNSLSLGVAIFCVLAFVMQMAFVVKELNRGR